MRRICHSGAVAALLLAVAAGPAVAAEPAVPWYQKWFGWGGKPEPKGDKARADAGKQPTVRASDDNSTRAREEAEYLRRQAVCDRMRELAIEKQDEHLMQEADRLEAESSEVYTNRTASLPAPRLSPEGKPGSQRASKEGRR
jgi:hypothetical protein